MMIVLPSTLRCFIRLRPRTFLRSSTTTSMDPSKTGQLAFDKSASSQARNHKSVNLDTVLAHSGVCPEEDNAPMSPPLHLATTYTRPPDGNYRDTDLIYTRADNPTRALLEQTMIQLETYGDDRPMNHDTISCAFASGMAAISMCILAHNDTLPLTIILPEYLYHGVPTILATAFPTVQLVIVNMTNVSTVQQALSKVNTPQAILWMESPTNPMCQVLDIERLCQLATASKHVQVTTIIDATLCPPCITQPLRLGVDAVVHSGTKYLGGHSDVLLGIVTTSPWTTRGRDFGRKLKSVQISAGAVASAFDSWLTLRGLRTLHIRTDRACQTAMLLANFFQSEPSTDIIVHYPGLETHPQHDVAVKQMKEGLFGGVLSVEFATEAFAMAFVGALQVAQRATSLGGTETLVEHRASIEPPGRVTSPPGLVRISVGLEDVNDLIVDFGRALTIAKQVVAIV